MPEHLSVQNALSHLQFLLEESTHMKMRSSTSYTEETKQPHTVILLENLNENMILPSQRI